MDYTGQAPLSMDFPGKNTEVGCHFLLQWIFWPGDQTHLSSIGRQILYNGTIREALFSQSSRPKDSSLIPLFSMLCCCCLVAKSCLTLCNPMDCSTPGFPVLYYLPEFAQTQVHWVGDAIRPPHPLLPPSLPALNLSHCQGLFQWVGFSHQVVKVLELQLSICPSNEYSGVISFRVDWFDLLAFSLLYGPNHTSTHDYHKNLIFDYTDIFVKTMSLLFNMLSEFVIDFLPKSKHLLISGLLSPSTVILEPKKIKSVTVSTFPPSICPEVMGPDAMILVFLNNEFQASFFTLLFHPQEAL